MIPDENDPADCSNCPRFQSVRPNGPLVFSAQLDRFLVPKSLFRYKDGIVLVRADSRAVILGLEAPPPENRPIELHPLSPVHAGKLMNDREIFNQIDLISFSHLVPDGDQPKVVQDTFYKAVAERVRSSGLSNCEDLAIARDLVEAVGAAPRTAAPELPTRSELQLLNFAYECKRSLAVKGPR